jgi:hypothetical protein
LRNIQDFSIYELASVWVDEVGGTSTGTAVGDDATVTNRADNFDNAQTVAASVGLDRIHVQSGNSITLTATLNGYELWGKLYTVALGGQDIGSTFFNGATISGIGTGTIPKFFDCLIGTATLPPCFVIDSGLTATLTVGSAGAYRFIDCRSGVAGASAPVVDLGGAVGATTMEFRRWSGGLTLNNVAAGDVVSVDVISGGTITVNGSGGTVVVRGLCNVVDGSSGSVTITESSVVNMTKINSEVDTAISDAALATASALATVDSNVDAILVDTGTTIPATLTDMSGATFDTATDSLEQIRNNIGAGDATAANQTTILSRLGIPSDLGSGADLSNNAADIDTAITGLSSAAAPNLLLDTTVASVVSTTKYRLNAGPATAIDDLYNDLAYVIFSDATDSNLKTAIAVTDWDGTNLDVTVEEAPAWTIVAGDGIKLMANPPVGTVDANLVSPTFSLQLVRTAVTDSNVVQQRGDSWSLDFTGLGDISNYQNIWFTAKKSLSDTDEESLIQIDYVTGLLYVNGAAPDSAGNGAISVVSESEGSIRVTVNAVETAKLPEVDRRYFDIQWKDNNGTIRTLGEGTFSVDLDITQEVC